MLRWAGVSKNTYFSSRAGEPAHRETAGQAAIRSPDATFSTDTVLATVSDGCKRLTSLQGVETAHQCALFVTRGAQRVVVVFLYQGVSFGLASNSDDRQQLILKEMATA
ncbi:hypothetical protein [Methylicorpusculum sp.]|uniref:hypothetical protein n=1 Tax=Methylicorpusculum sp. TaxID=2713644 RepID=UPI00272FF00E|nr:hypothetical protein [Methylicorpusculum sp.]MDP2179199.1 hypothetical protein [Methylicorpusculum sp.]MDP3527937.1 hypothetical protein [Methylicorpusculum sp.]